MTCRESQGGGESKGGNVPVNESVCYQDSCASSCAVGVKGRAAPGRGPRVRLVVGPWAGSRH